MSENLLKVWNVSVNPEEETRVIDNNETIARRLEWLAKQNIIPGADKTADTAADAMGSTADLLCEEEASRSGFTEGIEAPRVEVYDGPSAQELAEQAKQEAEQLLAQANADCEQIRAAARQEGMQQGYEEGMRQAQEKLQQEEARLQEREQTLEQAYWNRVEELEPELVDTLTGIYEHIFHVEFGEQKQLVLSLLTETMRGIEGCRDFLIHVSTADFARVREAKEEIASAAMSPEVSVEVIEDTTLARNECLIETGSGIYDCSLDTQLQELKRQMVLLSYVK